MTVQTRRGLLGAAVTLPLAAPALAAFPERPVRIVVPWNAGGSADVTVRTLSPAMSALLGQPVVVDNRPGANGAIGTQAVARAAPDGYTLILANAETHAINPLIYPRLTYNPVDDFMPVTVLVRTPFVLLARRGLGADDLAALLAMARASPARLTYATWGIGSIAHLAMESLSRQQGLQLTHIPYTGGSLAIAALLAGQVDLSLLNVNTAEVMAREGQAKPLAIGTSGRTPLLPDIPTFTECGVPIEIANWFGLLGPARLPQDVADRVAGAAREAARFRSVHDYITSQAAIPVFNTPEETRAFIAGDRERWTSVIRDLNLRLE